MEVIRPSTHQHDAGAHDVALVDGPDVDAGHGDADGRRLEKLQERLQRAQRRRLHAHPLTCTARNVASITLLHLIRQLQQHENHMCEHHGSQDGSSVACKECGMACCTISTATTAVRNAQWQILLVV